MNASRGCLQSKFHHLFSLVIIDTPLPVMLQYILIQEMWWGTYVPVGELLCEGVKLHVSSESQPQHLPILESLAAHLQQNY